MNVIIIGANGSIARLVEQTLISSPEFKNVYITMFLRDKQRVNDLIVENHSTSFEGDLYNLESLKNAFKDQDIVIDTTGATKDVETTQNIIDAMQANEIDRIVSINDLGIYDEVPGKFGEWNKRMVGSGLIVGKQSADLLETSSLNYTILRIAWLSNNDEINYEITYKDEPFKGTTVSRRSVADVILKIIGNPNYLENVSVGLNKPGTDGDQPQF
ncbi:uncharacterized protein YbjT (DUF2867 family) [Weissella uvarum]|uniref:NAD(P)H-binding protein n=1 Tax=Weissella uvarum TaxID=1479233 RepID=UPI001961C761|nr:NAD(P)H-binding protein [Weissella uvarum]MBM7617365.1 uncharacterized protein YbjT (DUF2867 family) [Weissella uvarum]MCM0595748.1 NAD(P)H-binding protein [Weissella uvarum]